MRKQRKNGMILAGLGGIAAALAVLSTPVGLIEMIVASTGLSESLPAAAPPLGMKARLLMAAFVALMAMGLVWTMTRDADRAERRPEREEQRRSRGVQGASKMGFALSKLAASKLAALARSRTRPSLTPGAPILRRADAHPDAPSRAPIFASRDFNGLDIFARTEPGNRELVVNVEPEHDPVVPATGLEMPSTPMPLAERDLPAPIQSIPGFEKPVPTFVQPHRAAERAIPSSALMRQTVREQHAPVLPIAPPAPVMRAEGLSIPELTERLERGLAMRSQPLPVAADPASVIADMPVARAVPVREAPAPDVDEALRAALGTLRTMTARAR